MYRGTRTDSAAAELRSSLQMESAYRLRDETLSMLGTFDWIRSKARERKKSMKIVKSVVV